VEQVVALTANKIDAYVGQRMRQRRENLGMSQGRLGRHLGLTFSQIQKYEKGANRIGAGRLYQISKYLGVSPLYFFEGLELLDQGGRPPVPATPQGPGDLAEEIAGLQDAFLAIPDPETRQSVLALVKSLAATGAAETERAK